jgi:hypothetical protein
MDIWQYYKAITRRLLVWSIVSVIAGVVLLALGALWQGVGLQAIAWGAIDAAIALVGGWVTRRRRVGLADPSASEVLAREARNLRRILLINTGLDVLYITGGVILALTLGTQNLFWRGNGWGIVIQGGFLFFFDLFHALACPGLGVPRPKETP